MDASYSAIGRKIKLEVTLENLELAEKVDLVVEGGHYVAASEHGPRMFRGFGGQKFFVEFFDGRRLETTNLWHQGKIPEHYRGRLPDNAKWGK